MSELHEIIAGLQAATAQIERVTEMIARLANGTPRPARLLFGSPCTGQISTTPNVFGLDWFDATGYAIYYGVEGAHGYHTGCDLNRPNYADSNHPVYAVADGEIVFAGSVLNWQAEVIVLKHWLEDGSLVWTRYAHLRDVSQAEALKRGDLLGYIADYNANGPKGDHLHFDVAKIDLGAQPGDWPGVDKRRLLNSYIDPQAWLKERRM